MRKNNTFSDKDLMEAIKTFAGSWIADTADTYFDVAKIMIHKDFDPEEAVELLEILYNAAAAEFGN